jgi:hypothetical protein
MTAFRRRVDDRAALAVASARRRTSSRAVAAVTAMLPGAERGGVLGWSRFIRTDRPPILFDIPGNGSNALTVK